ncbi:MAG: HAD family hydrolase [Candidatus Limivicinus sp.]|jgi:Cd2+/Zn2+-exporting ATPase
MRSGTDHVKHLASGGGKGTFDTVLIIRLVVASVIFAVSLIIKGLPGFVSTIMLIVSAIVAGYDIIIDAVSCISEKNFFATPVVVVVITLVSYIIGFGVDGAALIVLYQIGLLLVDYAEERTRLSALDLLHYQDEETVSKVTELVFQENAGYMGIEHSMRYSAGSILKLAVIFSVIYAIALPIFTNYSFAVSIHRAMMIILIATPMSIVISMPLTGIIGMCFSARHGVIFENAASMEAASAADTAIFDNAGIFTEGTPRLISLNSDFIDNNTFLTFVAHALYYSEQPVAKAVAAAYTKGYRPDLVSNFKDIPGYGVELDIGGGHLVLAVRELFEGRGIKIPSDESEEGQTFYMTISDRYVGRLVIDSELNQGAEELVAGLEEAGIRRCVLVTEDGNSESRRVADEMDFHEVYGECSTEKKLQIIEDLKTGSKNPVMYIYSKGIESHSAADVDIRVGNRGSYADALIKPDYLANLPFSIQVCKRMHEIAIENALFAYLVKIFLIFLSLIGYCNLWFAIFIDMVAAAATILNASRVTSESLISSLLYKTGR